MDRSDALGDGGSRPIQNRSEDHVPRSHSLHRLSAEANEAPSAAIFSGGSAVNAIAWELSDALRESDYILPISDDGGSTWDIIEHIGGPGVGDIRSRLVRLIVTDSDESKAVERLLTFRLDKEDPDKAKRDWLAIVEGEHELWNGIRNASKETIRAFFIQFHSEILRVSPQFEFRHGALGNYLFTGARLFFNSMEAAIFCFSRVANVKEDATVIPVMDCTTRVFIGAELEDGHLIVGQHDISHPNCAKTPVTPRPFAASQTLYKRGGTRVGARSGPGQRTVAKDDDTPLPSPIRSVFYCNQDLQTILPYPCGSMLEALRTDDHILYGMGSFFTSIWPCLVLRGVGEVIAERTCAKIFVINGTLDRETAGMRLVDFVLSATLALNTGGTYDHGSDFPLENAPLDYITHVITLDNHEDHTWEAFLEGEADDGSGTAPRQPELLEADDASTAEIEALGLKVVRVRSSAYGRYEVGALVDTIVALMEVHTMVGGVIDDDPFA